MEQDPDPPMWLVIIEVPIPGVLIGPIPLPQEPADPEVGWTTTDDAWE